MDLIEAQKFLGGTIRHELRDHAFGDTEIGWVRGEMTVGFGYFGHNAADVSITVTDEHEGTHVYSFSGEDARTLRECGELEVHRNDETGPDTYTEGEVMPGLSKSDVYHELTGEYLDES